MPFLDFLASFSARPAGGSGFIFRDNISVNTQNYNLRTRALAGGWNGTSPLQATVVVQPSILVTSSLSSTPAFATGTLPTGSQLTIINGGTIYGAGGNGASGGGVAGNAGGDAINITCRLSLANFGTIASGGGGGGGGGSFVVAATTFIGGSGGGGGAGQVVGTGGIGVAGTIATGSNGSPGTLGNGGAGGPSISGTGIVISLQSGTEFTSSAVYVSTAGATTYWYSINLAGTVTQIAGPSATVSYSGRIGLKIFASTENNANPSVRSNYVGQYFWQDFTAGSTKATATIPATIPGVDGGGAPVNIASFNLVGYLWGGTGRNSSGTNGGGGYTDFVGPITPNATVWVICAGAGYRGSANDSSRDADCKGKASQGGWSDNGGGLSGVFTSDPLDGNNAPLLTATSTAILGIAGGGGACYNNGTSGGGGGTTGQASSASNAGGGGTQTGGGSDATDSTVRAAAFMTGSVVGGSGGGTGTAGGGGGYYGGGGTFRNNATGSCGGGGGSGYFRVTGGYSGQTIQATDRNAANNTSDYYPGNNVGFGLSGSGDQGTGNRGQVRLYLR